MVVAAAMVVALRVGVCHYHIHDKNSSTFSPRRPRTHPNTQHSTTTLERARGRLEQHLRCPFGAAAGTNRKIFTNTHEHTLTHAHTHTRTHVHTHTRTHAHTHTRTHVHTHTRTAKRGGGDDNVDDEDDSEFFIIFCHRRAAAASRNLTTCVCACGCRRGEG